MKRQNPYIKQAIELAEESKKQLVINSDLINSLSNDSELGSTIRRMYREKVQQADDHIKHMKSLGENYLPTDSPGELQ